MTRANHRELNHSFYIIISYYFTENSVYTIIYYKMRENKENGFVKLRFYKYFYASLNF